MDPALWSEINRIFLSALDVDLSLRSAFVTAESRGNIEIESQVESLLRADAEAGSYLEEPAVPRAALQLPGVPLSDGDTLCGRFRIVRRIDEGGMGRVFEAFDQELCVPLAIKVIQPDIAGNPEAIARFRQEVRLARSITHANVCRTFDLEREMRETAEGKAELVFLTMEFLAGETLAARIKRDGALSPGEALAIARQVAGALQAAHALNIIHRDMKPANIMLVPSTASPQEGSHAVVTDFGLARLDPLALGEGLSGFTASGKQMGTLAYMAPEQLEGNPVSTATDIFAFGLILFEMITGERAFPSANLISGIGSRLRGWFPREKLDRPGIPIAWRNAIEDCLALDPAARPQDAAAVIAVLETERSLLTRRLRRSGARVRRVLPGTAVLVAAFLIAMALFAAGFRLYKSRAESHVAPGALVYLTPVKNQTGERSIDSITELLRAGLSQSTQLNLLDQGRAGDILQQMTKSPETAIDAATAREIAMRAGAPRVVFATVTGSGGRYRLDIAIQQPDDNPARYRRQWKKSFSWTVPASASDSIPPELLASVRDASDWIRNEAGESAHDIATLDTPPEDVTTSSWQALAAYSLAQKLVRDDKKDEAIAAFRQAIKADPGFSLAYAHLGDVLVAMNRRAEGYDAYLNALNTDAAQRLSRKERDFIQGSYASDTRDYATAVTSFRDYSAFYPNDFNAWYYQAMPLTMLGRPQEAVNAAIRADNLLLQTHGGAVEAAFGYILLGDYASANKWIDTIRRAGRNDQATYLEAPEEFLLGKYPEAERSYLQLQHSTSKSWRRFGFAGAVRVRAEEQDFDGALDTLSHEENEMGAVLSHTEKAALLLDRAYLYCKKNQMDRCVEEVAAAIQEDSVPDTILRAADTLGHAMQHLSHPSAARAVAIFHEMDRLLAGQNGGQGGGVIAELARLRVRGEIHLANGDVREALAEFRKADSLDAPFRPRDYMGRCLFAMAAHESDPAAAAPWREGALAAFGKVALRPAIVWRRATDYPPGLARDEMAQYIEVGRSLGRTDALERNLEAVLTRLHGVTAASRSQTSNWAPSPADARSVN